MIKGILIQLNKNLHILLIEQIILNISFIYLYSINNNNFILNYCHWTYINYYKLFAYYIDLFKFNYFFKKFYF